MATDITTLAIAIQSQEAERNLQTFNSLMLESSKLAAPLEKITLAVDAGAALAQIQALKTGYDDLADSIGGLNGIPDLSSANAGNMEAMKEFFAVTAEMSKAFRDEMTQLNDALQTLEANSGKASAAGSTGTATMSEAVTVSREYAAKLREVAAAQKELEKAVAEADAAMKATIEADEDAEAVKKRLEKAQRELAQVSKQLADTHRGMGGDIIELSQREENLKNKVAELKSAYAEAKAAAEKFGQKLEESGDKADAARNKYQRLGDELRAMPQPVANVNGGMSDFSANAKIAGTQLTKLARGFNSVAMLAGGAIPGVSGLGRALSMFGYVNPYLAGAAVAVGAIAAGVKFYESAVQSSLQGTRDYADLQVRITENYTEEAKEQQHQMERLVELSGREKLCNSEREEAVRLVGEIKEAMPGLGSVYNEITRDVEDMGLQYDEATGKIKLTTAALNEFYEIQGRRRKELLESQKKAQEKTVSRDAVEIQRSFGSVKTGFISGIVNGISPGSGILLEKAAQEVEAKIAASVGALQKAKDPKEKQKILDDLEGFIAKYQEEHGALEKIFDLDDVQKAIQKEREGIKALAKTDAELKKKLIGGRTEETVSKSVANLTRQLRAAERAAMSPDEKSAANQKRIAELEARKAELAAETDDKKILKLKDENGEEKELTVAEWRLKTEIELSKRIQERKKNEEQITKQIEAQKAKTEAQEAKLRAFAAKYNLDANGEIIGKADSNQRRLARDQEAEMLKAQIRKYTMLRDGASTSETYSKYQGKINEAQAQLNANREAQFQDDEANKNTRQRLADARKNFVFDRQGNMVRRKTEAERLNMMKQEIAAQKAKVQATTEGSTERYQEQQKLDALQQKYFQERMKNSAPAFAQQQIRNNSTVVQGIQARSSEALRLQARNFNRPENGFKDIGTSVKSIYDELKTIGPDTKTIADKTSALVEMIETV